MDGLQCHYCGPCERGCSTFSYFSSPFTTVKDALASGNCTLFTNAVVSHVDMDTEPNKARGVTYVDRLTRQVKRGTRKSRDPLRAGDGIDANFAELLNARVSQWAGELQRRAGTLFDGPRCWRRSVRPSAKLQPPSQCE